MGNNSSYIRDFDKLKFPRTFSTCQYLIIGKTGVGKSATGNTLLGKDFFKKSIYNNSLNSETNICQRGRNDRSENFEIVVMDTPGLMDSEHQPKWAESIIARSLLHSGYTPNVILYIIKASNRIADIDEQVLNCVTNLFGPDCFKYMIVVFTCEDQLGTRPLVDCLLEASNNKALTRLLQNVGSRYLTITNSKNLSYEKINEQILELLKMTQRMMVCNKPQHFTCTLPAFDTAAKNQEFFRDIPPPPPPQSSCVLF